MRSPLHYAAVLLMLPLAGCAGGEPGTLIPGQRIVAAQQGAPPPVTKPPTPTSPRPESAAAPAREPEAGAPQSGKEAAPPVAGAPATAPSLDLTTLEKELKETKAIGFFTKISLKNQVDDLLDRFRDYYGGKGKLTMTDLRRSFDLLVMKVLSLLQDEDQQLASRIVSSREAIWNLLADPKAFGALET